MLAKEVKKLSDFKSFLVKSSLLSLYSLCQIILLYLNNFNFYELFKVNISANIGSWGRLEALAS